MKRFLALILCLVMFVAVLAACGSSDGGQETKKENTTTAGSKETEAETRLSVNLPDTKFNKSFDVLHWTVTEGWIPWEEIAVEAMTGDTMEDSVFERNAAVSELLDVEFTVEYIHTNDLTTTAKTNVSAGDDTHELYCQRAVSWASAYSDGIFRNWQDLPYVDFSKPWWNQDSITSLALGELQQFVASDFLLLDKAATACWFFNMSAAETYSEATGDMYQLVRDKAWTMEKFMEICDTVAEDRNGDGLKNGDEDFIAFMSADDPVHFLYTGAGLRFMDHTSDGHFEYKFGDAESLDIMQEILDDVMGADWSRNSYLEPVGDGVDKFRIGEQLFAAGLVKNANNFRQNETDYGILPVPKYDESDKSYHSEVSPHHDTLMSIPGSVTDLEFVGAVLEAVSAEAHYTSYPTFYDVIITGRSIRDQESKEMLEIIFNTRVYDAGLIYDLDHFAEYNVLRATKNPGLSITTTYASKVSVLEKKLKELNEIVDRLNA